MLYDFKDKNPGLMSPLTLAFIGDSVWDVYIRSRIIAEMPAMPVNKLHRAAVRFAKAHGQCIAFDAIADMLTEDEMSAFKRGRNASQHTTAKNATLADYKRATGFEAILGFVYISGHEERLNMLMRTAFDAVIEQAE